MYVLRSFSMVDREQKELSFDSGILIALFSVQLLATASTDKMVGREILMLPQLIV